MIKTNLAVLMAERGLKIADVYEATGISKTTLMAISENTGKGIQYETVDKLCNYLEVSPSDFFVYAPYIFNIFDSSFNKAVGGSEYSHNLFCNIKKGESESNFDIGLFFTDGTNSDVSGDLLDDYYKDLSNYDLVIMFLFQHDNASFLKFYNSLQTQFKTTVKQDLFSAAINQINLGNITDVESMDNEKSVHISRPLSSLIKDKKTINVLFALSDDIVPGSGDECSNVYVEKVLKVKGEKILLK